MSGLEGIGVSVQSLREPNGGGCAQALLAELETALQRLLETGEEHSIDLRSLPLAPGELDHLRDTLGSGEVRIEITALGPSSITETAIRGVWWVTHRNAHDELMAEFLEIGFCPGIVAAQRDDVAEGLELLKARLAGDETP